MANRNFKFPRVDIKSYARVKSVARPDTPDTTVLFMPIMSDIGPSQQIVKIHDLDEYVSYFGRPAFNKIGISAIALTRWLNAGGTLYAYRLVSKGKDSEGNAGPDYASYAVNTKGTTPQTLLSFRAKYAGDYYNDIRMNIEEAVSDTVDSFNVTIWLASDASTREVYNRVSSAQLSNVLNAGSELVADVEYQNVTITTSTNVDGETVETAVTYNLHSIAGTTLMIGKDQSSADFTYTSIPFIAGTDTYYELLTKAWDVSEDNKGNPKGELVRLFLNVNETTVDLLIDPGYTGELKKVLYNAMHYVLDETNREDLFVAFSSIIVNERRQEDGTKVADGKGAKGKSGIISEYTGFGSDIPYTDTDNAEDESVMIVASRLNGWFAVFDQYGIMRDAIYNQNAELCIPLTIMFAQNVAYNDNTYSMHRPTAGETYGVINGLTSLNYTPNVYQKDDLFKKRWNYAERSSNSIEFMTNRTFYHADSTGKQSSLDFINNVRVKNKIVRDLRKILRKYLYEYADGATLLRCMNECNAYLNGWINNKALVKASIDVSLDPVTEEYMYATLAIKFRAALEFINVEIYLD